MNSILPGLAIEHEETEQAAHPTQPIVESQWRFIEYEFDEIERLMTRVEQRANRLRKWQRHGLVNSSLMSSVDNDMACLAQWYSRLRNRIIMTSELGMWFQECGLDGGGI